MLQSKNFLTSCVSESRFTTDESVVRSASTREADIDTPLHKVLQNFHYGSNSITINVKQSSTIVNLFIYAHYITVLYINEYITDDQHCGKYA